MTSEEKISQVVECLIELRSFAIVIDKSFRSDLSVNNISICEFPYLLILSQAENGYTMVELSALAKVDKSLITRVIKCLENKGYIYRDTNNPSSRKYKIKLTKLGVEKVKIVNSIILREREKFMNNYSERELRIIEEAFSLLREKKLKKGYREE